MVFQSIEGTLKHRDVQHFGYEFRYGSNDVDPNCPLERGIPPECDIIWNNLREHGMDIEPDQLTVNYYKPGQGEIVGKLFITFIHSIHRIKV